MSDTAPEKISESRAYWTHKVEAFPSPVAQFRMAQLIDFDSRLYENARIVFRFLCAWYHDEYGDALLSQRHVAKVMKQRAPEGAATLSNRTVGRAIIALMETGWVARTYKGRGKGKGASRYVPVINVLELAAQGRFPEPGQYPVPVEPGHPNGPLVGHSNGPVDGELGHSIGPKTLLPDPPTGGVTVSSTDAVSAAPPCGLSADEAAGFEKIWKAYGKLGDKQASRAAWEAIDNPDIEHIAERAASWAASAKAGQRRMPLEKWLAQEKYDQADRIVGGEPKAKAKAAAKSKVDVAANDNARNEDDDMKISTKIPHAPRRLSRRAGKIANATVEMIGGDNVLTVRLQDGHERHLHVESADFKMQEQGQKELNQLSGAAGFDIEDARQLNGLGVFLVEYDDGSARWEAA